MYSVEKTGNSVIYSDKMLGVRLELDEKNYAGFVQTQQLPEIGGIEEIRKAFYNPVSGKRLSEIAAERKSKTACILISDATRGIPTAPMAKVAVEELLKGGLELRDILFVVAIGVHRPATEKEMQEALGELYGKVRCENHTPFDEDNLVFLGKTSDGTPVSVNKRAYECELHIQIGKVEPHEFAGFSGGRKSVLPGISSEETIVYNHRPDRILNPASAIGKLEGNPVNQDMVESAEMFRIDFGVNCILNNSMKISAVFTGELVSCHESAVSYVREYLGVGIDKPDVIVTCPGQPLDIDFYQSAKALIALTEVVDESVTVLMLCGCPEGVNSPDMLRAFGSGRTLEEIQRFTCENYKIQMDHVLLLSKIFAKGTKIVLSCPNVSDDEARTMLMEPCKNPQEALKLAMRLSGKSEPKVLFYPRTQTGLPYIK